jgi:hypothetical protein
MKPQVDDVAFLLENKKDYTHHLYELLTEPILLEFQGIYKSLLTSNTNPNGVLEKFQDALAQLPLWNADQVTALKDRLVIRMQCDYFTNLVKATFMVFLKVHLASSEARPAIKIKVKVPSMETFIHRIFISCARSFWKKPFLFYHKVRSIDQQKNLLQCESYVHKSIVQTIQKSLPLDDLFKLASEEETYEESHEHVSKEEESECTSSHESDEADESESISVKSEEASESEREEGDESNNESESERESEGSDTCESESEVNSDEPTPITVHNDEKESESLLDVLIETSEASENLLSTKANEITQESDLFYLKNEPVEKVSDLQPIETVSRYPVGIMPIDDKKISTSSTIKEVDIVAKAKKQLIKPVKSFKDPLLHRPQSLHLKRDRMKGPNDAFF